MTAGGVVVGALMALAFIAAVFIGDYQNDQAWRNKLKIYADAGRQMVVVTEQGDTLCVEAHWCKEAE